MRQGYVPYLMAQDWMRRNKGRDVNTTIGGVMGAGCHEATAIERWQGFDFVEYIFRSSDNCLHKERCFGRSHTRFALGRTYQFELEYGGDGNCRIEAAAGGYRLLLTSSGAHLYEADNIAELYVYVKAHNFKLVYLKIKWSREKGV